MNIEALKDQLIEHEGCRLKPYRCPGGKLTIGVGRNLDAKGISLNEAMVLLYNDIGECLAGCRELFPKFDELDDTRQHVLIDMRFNLGQRGLKRFRKMREAIAKGDYTEAANEMLKSKWARQVKTRAFHLASWMVRGDESQESPNGT